MLRSLWVAIITRHGQQQRTTVWTVHVGANGSVHRINAIRPTAAAAAAGRLLEWYWFDQEATCAVRVPGTARGRGAVCPAHGHARQSVVRSNAAGWIPADLCVCRIIRVNDNNQQNGTRHWTEREIHRLKRKSATPGGRSFQRRQQWLPIDTSTIIARQKL